MSMTKMHRWFDKLIDEAPDNYYSRHTPVWDYIGGEDVKFHKAGHNATHEFWVGIMADDRIVLRTVGEGELNENGDPTTIEIRINILKPGEVPSYLVHW
jgi:hypothetical protein